LAGFGGQWAQNGHDGIVNFQVDEQKAKMYDGAVLAIFRLHSLAPRQERVGKVFRRVTCAGGT